MYVWSTEFVRAQQQQTGPDSVRFLALGCMPGSKKRSNDWSTKRVLQRLYIYPGSDAVVVEKPAHTLRYTSTPIYMCGGSSNVFL